MRLYKLISRHGKETKRLWPWFKPPAPDAPKEYAGWLWSPEEKEWVKVQREQVVIEVTKTRYPKPDWTPRPAQSYDVPGWLWNYELEIWEEVPLTPQELSEGLERGPMPGFPPGPELPSEVEGWSWSEYQEEWIATIIIAERIGFTPPQTLPPNLTEAAVFEIYSFEQLFIEEVNAFVAQGYTLEAARRITRANFDNLIRIMYAKQQLATGSFWFRMAAEISGQRVDDLKDLTVIGIVYLLAAIAGIVMGTILQRFTFRDDENYILFERKATYLLGPENWSYSKHIGTSLGGRTFYSKCMEIGTEYVRFRRQRGKFGYDIIDFPGGFVETGYQFPYWVKYTWSEWKLVYVGMLESVGARFYMLKKADVDQYARMRPGQMIKEENWCSGFHHYL